MAKANRGFLLSYQAESHLYERLNVKKTIVTALVKGEAKKLKSFTDSTIYFEMLTEEKAQPSDCKKVLIAKFKDEGLVLKYTIATLWDFTSGAFTFDSDNGDKTLNNHFQTIVSEVRKKENKLETNT